MREPGLTLEIGSKILGLIISFFTHETDPFLSVHFPALALMLVRERRVVSWAS